MMNQSRVLKRIALILSIILILPNVVACSSKMDRENSTTGQNGSKSSSDINFGSQVALQDTTSLSKTESDGLYVSYKLDGDNSNNMDFSTEEYNAVIEQGYQSTKNHPLSTFSADVDTASYSNIRRMLKEGRRVDTGAVRIEEMLNYFNYDYKLPEGDSPFGITTELSDCPWNPDTKLFLAGIQTEKIDFSKSAPSNLVFLIDVSGSMMDEDKLPLVQRAFLLLTENLTEKDRISIVTYAGNDTVVLSGAKGNQKEKIQNAITELEAGGSTFGSKGIETAYQLAMENYIEGGNNRVILATDGDLNVGVTSESELTNLIEEKRKSGVALSVLGFGTGNIKDNKMEALADHGNGNYAYIDSLMEARKVLVEEMGATLVTVAGDVKFQVEFNPAKVKGYRLLGYDNRLLATEDFNDDTKDAGEVGAGHSVTVLYELVLEDSKMEIPETELKYTTTEPTNMVDELLTVNIRYKKPGKDKSILMSEPVGINQLADTRTDNLAFATAVAEFGLLLKDSEYKGDATFSKVLSRLEETNYKQDEYRAEFYQLVKLAKDIY
ncbi:von Willebrand factor type A [Lachnoclostridium phytofermentans ISDg]|uniref:von Willebrand factor type A n=2 Tax=Lachnoclostridium phytofermentans TaxID=66219 RepID=A9KS19_LACP7|nr:von Willebrand factor type A [Lachnoclostridium phytofermentans ISDg]